jgi:hypothetical protein
MKQNCFPDECGEPGTGGVAGRKPAAWRRLSMSSLPYIQTRAKGDKCTRPPNTTMWLLILPGLKDSILGRREKTIFIKAQSDDNVDFCLQFSKGLSNMT